MKAIWQTKITFWMAIFASGVWLVLSIALGFLGIRVFLGPCIKPIGREPLEVMIALFFVLQPVFVLILTIRAVRFRNVGQPLRIIVRALYPLVLVVLLIPYVKAIEYLRYQEEGRRVQRWYGIGTITYVCSTMSPTADYDPKTIGAITLRLTEARHPKTLGTWIVEWPGKKPIEAVSFRADTRSIGGSQGIRWREPDGRQMIAYISFSDVMTEHGPGSIWLSLAHGDKAQKDPNPDMTRRPNYTCRPDPNSYRE